ncbi:myeloid leukemia factor 1 isoform X5 [Anolis carolinensis]|uniref:myeloid leukemia factor 1 isoform X5 n=1 Tax=Anolis carolinensis TaxID=28377 RepID=UPI002F2B6707
MDSAHHQHQQPCFGDRNNNNKGLANSVRQTLGLNTVAMVTSTPLCRWPPSWVRTTANREREGRGFGSEGGGERGGAVTSCEEKSPPGFWRRRSSSRSTSGAGAMFGSLSRVFEEDPFFRDPFAAHNEHVRRFFSEPFGRDPFLAIKNGGERSIDHRGRPDSQVALRNNHKDKMAVDQNAHTFSSSSVMTYSKKGDEPPKIFQASAQTRMAPGGIKETRKALKDSESGLEKMAIGHHIQDRGHVIQKEKNNKTGNEELNQEFINLDETEAQAFDDQWQKEIVKFKPSLGRNNRNVTRHRSIQHLGKEDAVRREKTHPRTPIEGSRRQQSSAEKLSVKGSHVPLKASKK